jgi:hypothetical protein
MANSSASIQSWRIPVWWMFANLLGWGAGLMLGWLLTLILARLDWVNEDRALVYAVLLSLGLTCGVAQWWVIKAYLPHSFYWIPVTLAGYGLALLVMMVSQGRNAVGSITFVLITAAIGLPQWLLLQKHYRRAGLWIPATVIGFLGFLWLLANPASSLTGIVIIGAILGALAAAPPGIVLAWLVRQPQSAGA